VLFRSRLHYDCAKYLTTLNCPLCEQLIDNYPQNIKNQIEINKEKYQKQLDKEDRLEAERIEIELSVIKKSPLYEEILMAFRYLIYNNIPIRYLPIYIDIKLYKGPKPEGMIYNFIINEVLTKIGQDLFDFNELSDDVDDDYFLKENVIYSKVKRNINIKEL